MMCALFMILHLNTKCTKMRSSLSIYIIQTLIMFKKGKKLQYQFKERCFTQGRIASQRKVHLSRSMTFDGQCTRIGSLQVPTQESTKQISSREIKDPKDTRKTKES